MTGSYGPIFKLCLPFIKGFSFYTICSWPPGCRALMRSANSTHFIMKLLFLVVKQVDDNIHKDIWKIYKHLHKDSDSRAHFLSILNTINNNLLRARMFEHITPSSLLTSFLCRTLEVGNNVYYHSALISTRNASLFSASDYSKKVTILRSSSLNDLL